MTERRSFVKVASAWIAVAPENLPVFGAIVSGLHVAGVAGPLVDALAVLAVVARVFQSLVHVCFVPTNRMASVRFTFFFVQVLCFAWLIGIMVGSV